MKTLLIVGYRWFNKRTGNTYHSATIEVDGKDVGKVDYAYGYGDQYVETAKQWLMSTGYLPKTDDMKQQRLWTYCRENNIQLRYIAHDVKRKKDL